MIMPRKVVIRCEQENNKQIFQKRNMRKPHSIKFISQAFKVSERMNTKETLQYFDSLSIDYITACKYHTIVKKLSTDYLLDIDEPNV